MKTVERAGGRGIEGGDNVAGVHGSVLVALMRKNRTAVSGFTVTEEVSPLPGRSMWGGRSVQATGEVRLVADCNV